MLCDSTARLGSVQQVYNVGLVFHQSELNILFHTEGLKYIAVHAAKMQILCCRIF